MENVCTAGHVTDNSMAQAHCMLDTLGYKHTHSEYVTIIALPLQQRLHERASILLLTYIACLVCLHIKTLTFILQINRCNNSPLQTNSVT